MNRTPASRRRAPTAAGSATGVALSLLSVVLPLAIGCQQPDRIEAPQVTGPQSGQPGETLAFLACNDGNGKRNLSYLSDWGDNSEQYWSPEVPIGDSIRLLHVYAEPGSYGIRARARDEEHVESDWSAVFTVAVGFTGPVTPSGLSGPEAGHIDTALSFSANAEHVRGESVSLQFDWGGTLGDWTGFVATPATVTDTHRFQTRDTFGVRCRAKDRAGTITPWSAPFLVLIGSRELEPPTGLRLASFSGVYVRLRWDTGRNDSTVTYGIWFRDLDSTGFTLVDTVAGRTYLHDPYWSTGWYTVSATRSGEERWGAETLATVPVLSDTWLVGELNSDMPSGYGWDAATGLAVMLEMQDSASAPFVDWYFTDLTPGFSGPAYYVRSPARAPEDPGGGVPPADWSRTMFAPVYGNTQEPLPEYDSLFYQEFAELGSFVSHVAVHRPDGRYALVTLLSPDPLSGTVPVVSWFQQVPGLRLIRHPSVAFPRPR